MGCQVMSGWMFAHCEGQVMEGALEVSEYTEVVDCYHNMSLQASG